MMLCYGQTLPLICRQIRIESYCLLTPNIEPPQFSTRVIPWASRGRKKGPIDIRLTAVAPGTSAMRTMTAENSRQLQKNQLGRISSIGVHKHFFSQML
jgi:hypothetical protein